MTDFLRRTQTTGVVANVAEYVVMLFVAIMTGVSTLRLVGILPLSNGESTRGCLSINILDINCRTVYNSCCITLRKARNADLLPTGLFRSHPSSLKFTPCPSHAVPDPGFSLAVCSDSAGRSCWDRNAT